MFLYTRLGDISDGISELSRETTAFFARSWRESAFIRALQKKAYTRRRAPELSAAFLAWEIPPFLDAKAFFSSPAEITTPGILAQENHMSRHEKPEVVRLGSCGPAATNRASVPFAATAAAVHSPS